MRFSLLKTPCFQGFSSIDILYGCLYNCDIETGLSFDFFWKGECKSWVTYGWPLRAAAHGTLDKC